jgi:hypothetical protein
MTDQLGARVPRMERTLHIALHLGMLVIWLLTGRGYLGFVWPILGWPAPSREA